MVQFRVDIALIPFARVRADEVQPLQVKNVECLSANHADVPVLVEPAACVLSLVAETLFFHHLGRFVHVKLLVVEEAIWG